MRKEFGERGLAHSLIYKANKYFSRTDHEAPVIVSGLHIDYPYSSVADAPYDQPVPDIVWENYKTLRDLFEPENIPPHWMDFMKEVDICRKRKGCKGPINLVEGLQLLIVESPDAKLYGLSEIEINEEEGEYDLKDGSKIADQINTVLSVPDLRNRFKNILMCMVPDESPGLIDKSDVAKILSKTGLKDGIALDLGCGTGKDTLEWEEKLGLFTVGVDRQYHARWYDSSWIDANRNNPYLNFVRADCSNLPFADSSIDVAIFHYVVQHVTQKSLQHALSEVKRALKEGGFLVVGPQSTEGFKSWRFFKKEIDSDQRPIFREYSYYSFIPEDRSLAVNRKVAKKRKTSADLNLDD